MDEIRRKPHRLKDYDYSQTGAYFITICTKDKKPYFWSSAGDAVGLNNLSAYGRVIEEAIQGIPKHYPNVSVEKYVVMPNHIHLLLMLSDHQEHRLPTIATIINQMKGYVTKQLGFPVWQKSFYDHIVRSERDYLEIWKYIDENPLKWNEDRFYTDFP